MVTAGQLYWVFSLLCNCSGESQNDEASRQKRRLKAVVRRFFSASLSLCFLCFYSFVFNKIKLSCYFMITIFLWEVLHSPLDI